MNNESMKRGRLGRLGVPGLGVAVLLGLAMTARGQTPVVETQHYSYLPQEAIAVYYRNAPANPNDWIGIYPDGVTPGSVGSTLWQYVFGAEGTALFGGGLDLAGDWKAYLLLTDGYDIAAETAFRVADPFSPFVRPDRRAYTPAAPITVTFTNGPANPKDWIGIYPSGVTPGDQDSLLWSYVDPANPGVVGVAFGSVTFGAGLPLGEYVAYLLLDDGYSVLAAEPFRVVTPPAAPARVLAVQPATGATGVSPQPTYRAVITNGTTRVTASGITLKLDGNVVTPTVDDQTTHVVVTYTPPTLFAHDSQPTFELVIADNGIPPNTSTNVTTFTVRRIDLTLPTPAFFENFDGTAEGALPGGWTELNYTEVTNPELDLGNLDSLSYATWVTVEASRFTGSFVTYSNPDNPQGWEDDYRRVLNYGANYVVNGQLVSALASGRLVFGNSGYRNGNAQIMYLTSPTVNLAGKTDLYLVFHSVWEQNQDSIAGVEYSIDNGQTWKPVVYMIDQADLIRDGEGNVDAVATLNEARGDVPTYVDPATLETKGGNYGDFLGVPVDASLAPFLSGRIDDNSFDSKRVEMFRLAEADNQAQVKIRFFHAGWDSWYFGLDNVGIYSVPATQPPVIVTPPASVTVLEGDPAALSVAAQGGDNLTYQWFKDGQAVEGATGATLSVPAARLSDAGSYSVRVTNESGSVESAAATLTVTPLPPAVTGVWNFADLTVSEGVGLLEYASVETGPATTFGTSDGTTVPHIGGQAATYMRVPAFTVAGDGYNLSMPTVPNGGGGYLNRYTMIWDILIPSPLNWTPLFNSAPGNGNDADFYVTDTGSLGIGALGYSAAGAMAADRWHRVAFVANLGAGVVRYYVDGVQVHQLAGASILDGRFALYTGNDTGPDVRLFNEPTGSYTHELLVSSFRFTDRTLSAAEIGSLGGPTAAGIPSGITPSIELSVSRSGNTLTLSWTGTGTFQVKKAGSLTNPTWENLGAPTTQNTATDTIGDGTAFYRVQMLP